MTPSRTPADLAELLTTVERELSSLDSGDAVLAALTRLAVEQVDGAEYAGITQGRGGRFTSAVPTDPLVEHVDKIQYELGSGPCVDSVLQARVFRADDLRTDPRWPEFGRQASEATGVLSMLAIRLFLESDPAMIAGLNMYATRAVAFGQDSENAAMVLATAGALTFSGVLAKEKAANLEIALRNSREIGIAIGVLMATHKLTREQGFDLLRIASQATHRKLRDIATEVADTGALPQIIPRPKQDAG
jgi:hypothetical protein